MITAIGAISVLSVTMTSSMMSAAIYDIRRDFPGHTAESYIMSESAARLSVSLADGQSHQSSSSASWSVPCFGRRVPRSLVVAGCSSRPSYPSPSSTLRAAAHTRSKPCLCSDFLRAHSEVVV
jgi:hypothetical protein